MFRLDNLDENRLDQSLRYLLENMRDLKTRQRLGGASLVFSMSEEPDTYDWEGTLHSPGGAAAPLATLIVTAQSQNQEDAVCDLISELYVNGARYTWADYYDGVSPQSFYRVYPEAPDVQNRNIRQWRIVVVGANTTTPYAMKFRIVGSDTMSINVTEV